MLTRRHFCKSLVALGLTTTIHTLPSGMGWATARSRAIRPFAPALVRNLGMLRPYWNSLPTAASPEMCLTRMAHEGLAIRLLTRPTELLHTVYAQRLTRELEAIQSRGLASILLFVTEITGYALALNIPVGSGSGECAGSLVLYALGVTDLDPLVHGLVFERFIRHDGSRDISLPVASNGWEKVEAYAVDRARGLGLEVAREQGFLEDLTIVVLNPLQASEPSGVSLRTIELEVRALAEISLLNQTLRHIVGQQGACAGRQGAPACLDLSRIPLDDSMTYALLFSDRGPGVCMLTGDGKGTVERIVRYQPEAWEGAQIAELFRPVGFTDWVILKYLSLEDLRQRRILPDFLRAKRGIRRPSWNLPQVRQLLRDTYGEIVFCEQVLLLGRHVAGMSFEEAMALRRALFIGKSDEVEVMKQKGRFLSGACAHGFPPSESEDLFEHLVSRTACTRSKASAVGPALQTYWAGYLKAHYPLEFATALKCIQDREPRRLTWLA